MSNKAESIPSCRKNMRTRLKILFTPTPPCPETVDTIAKINQAEKTISHLRAQNDTLRDDLVQVKENYSEKINDAYKGLLAVVRALNMLKYPLGDGTPNGYQANLTDKQLGHYKRGGRCLGE